MTEEENLIIKELIQLTLTYNVSKVDKGMNRLTPTFITGQIKNQNYIVLWNFNKADHSGLLGLYENEQNSSSGKLRLVNICYHNKPDFFVEKIVVDCNDYNYFLEIFRKFDKIKKK